MSDFGHAIETCSCGASLDIEVHCAHLSERLEEWRKKALDVHSVVADPKFVDPAKDDFNLKGDSPAIKAGFKPFDQADVGPRSEARVLHAS